MAAVGTGPRMAGQSVDKQDLKDQITLEMEAQRQEVWRKGAIVAVKASIAHTAAQDLHEAEDSKKAAYLIFEQALGVDFNSLMTTGACSVAMRALPKIMFLFVIVGCELDYYGFVMSFSTYWMLGILPLRVLLLTGPLGYFVAVAMFIVYNFQPEAQPKPTKVPSAPSANPLKPEACAIPDDPEAAGPLRIMINDSKEPISLKYYHFLPIVRYYLVIKDANPSDVEGLFRVNSLSSFTLGISQVCGILFSQVVGGNMNIFVKINIASQCINWMITLLYFSTSISNRMKASFKVDTLFYNSTTSLREEYESYLNMTLEAAAAGGGQYRQAEIDKFHNSLNFEMSEFVKQEIDLSAFSMEDKYKMRQAVRKKMYATYLTIQ